ncbi:TlpA disulfide reductase family protein [Mucilaginibacter segetis]|uniref:TlpA family protein disulfide reductase n=1 Tax=Mucilaginibacter segetis TaxID=2793071 RepID=A0A934PSY6_9SPHI|nr:TlpA disulfide reductase family protein [Mucilaginibacter segetis]MBK0380239.1 TlpA family protein disulfide reductase [Mucilaginibacter segetis]
MIKKVILNCILFTVIACAGFAQVKLSDGTWRGALITKTGNEIPFNFEVTHTNGKAVIAIINNTERFKVNDITIRQDSVFIKMPLFDSEFRLKLADNTLTGQWIKHLGESDVPMDFTATANTPWRFLASPEPPAQNLSGRWSAIFGDGDSRDTTVGEFTQTGNKIAGTFLTTTGDYRFLEGTVSDNKLQLSCFDGGHAFLFTADIKNDKTLTNGKFFSGSTGTDVWEALRNENAKLPDAYSLTALKPGYKTLAFSFKDLNGKAVSLTDQRFKNKVVIVQILGSWCPNCMDETAYLAGYYKKYHPKGVEIVGLAYERTTDFDRSKRVLTQIKKRFNIAYPLLITGYTNNKTEAAKSLPMLTKVVSFPSTIIIDKSGNVRKIHTGFSGPGTGEHYTEFINEFEKLTDDLLAEK